MFVAVKARGMADVAERARAVDGQLGSIAAWRKTDSFIRWIATPAPALPSASQ
jgi:hypothetical protein